MRTRIVSILVLLSIGLSVSLAPAEANAEHPRPRGVAAILGLQAIANRMGDRSQVSSNAGDTAIPLAGWRNRAPAPSSRAAGTLTFVRDSAGNLNLWYIGGLIDVLGNATGEVDEYNARANTWTANVTAMPMPAGGHCAVAVGQTIYVIGGTNGLRMNIGVQAYDTATNTWSTGFDPLPGSLPNGLGLQGCGAVDRAIYVFGGGDPVTLTPFALTFKFEPYEPAGSQWTQLPFLMNTARAAFGYVTDAAGGKIYTAGGSTAVDPNTGLPNEVPFVEVFDPTTGWSTLPDMPLARTGAALFLFQNKTELVITGGGVLPSLNSTSICTLPACSTWVAGSSLKGARTGPAYAGIRNALFVVGGVDVTLPFNITFLNTVERLVP